MSRKRQRKSEPDKAIQAAVVARLKRGQPSAPQWPVDGSRLLMTGGVVLIALCIAMIYGQQSPSHPLTTMIIFT